MRPIAPEARSQEDVPVGRILKHVFPLILAAWLLIPIFFIAAPAQDASTFLAAGKLARTHPHEVYSTVDGDIWHVSPKFRKKWCEIEGVKADCNKHAVAFLSVPSSLPIMSAAITQGSGTGILLFRFASVLMLVIGMELLWRKLAPRTKRAPALLVATAALLTPLAIYTVVLGQTSPILFLSVCLGISSRRFVDKATQGVIWALAVLLKLSPIMLTPLLLPKRRRTILFSALLVIALLTVINAALTPASLWHDFFTNAKLVNAASLHFHANSSIGVLIAPALSTGIANTLIRAVLAAGACWYGMRKVNDDVRWAIGYLAVLILIPVVWWHYQWILIGAIGTLLIARQKITEHAIGILPLSAAVLLVPTVMQLRGTIHPDAQALVFCAGVVVVLWLSRTLRNEPPPKSAQPSGPRAIPEGIALH